MIPGSFPVLLAPASGGYVIEGSGLFDGSTGRLVWTPSGAGDSRTKRIFEIHFKLGGLGTQRNFLQAGAAGSDYELISLNASDKISSHGYTSGALKYNYISTAVLRDPAAYYVLIQERDGNTINHYLFADGLLTDFDTTSAPSSFDGHFGTSVQHYIGRSPFADSQYFDGYIARIAYYDNQTFTEANHIELTDDGFWQINDVSDLTFGTNGFLIEGGTNVAAGTDSSGNSNSFTKTGSITATSDSPTDGGADDEYGNLATFSGMLHGITGAGSGILVASNGGRTYGVGVTNGSPTALASIPIPPGSLIYCEVDLDSVNTSYGAQSVGIMEADFEDKYQDYGGGGIGKGGAELSCSGYYTKYRTSVYDGTRTDITGTSRPTSGDRVRIAVDTVNDEIFFGLEAAWFNGTTAATGGDPAASTGGLSITTGKDWLIGGTCINGQHTWYFDEADWEQTAPTGYTSLSTANLPTPAVTNYEDHYYIEAGISHSNGSTTAVTLPWNTSTYETMVTVKRTDSTGSWYRVDTLRGGTKAAQMEGAAPDITNSDGGFSGTSFVITSDYASGTYLLEATKYGLVADTAANEEGSINTLKTTSNNDSKAFMLTWTGTASNGTIGHGLDVAPDFIVACDTDTSANCDRLVFHKDLPSAGRIFLDTAAAADTNANGWQNTPPTTTLISVGTGSFNTAGTSVMWGYASSSVFYFGSYTGNANVDGPMINMGAFPTTSLIKSAGSADWWWFESDVMNTPGNPFIESLSPNETRAQTTSATIDSDQLSNGKKIRGTHGTFNRVSTQYIYGAFGIQPIQGNGKDTSQGRAK